MSPSLRSSGAFPLYLLPSIPFRSRRHSSTSNATVSSSPSCSPSSSPPANPSHFLASNPTSHLRCAYCLTDLVPTSSIISKGFTGRHGRAYLCAAPPPCSLFPSVLPPSSSATPSSPAGQTCFTPGNIPNTTTHKPVPRQLVTGAHTVSDISCTTCGSVIGWKYVAAEEEAQRYKVGKFILETRRVVRGSAWDEYGDAADHDNNDDLFGNAGGSDDVEFDSQDEDECEDLFAGVWSVKSAVARRKRRIVTSRVASTAARPFVR